VPVASEDQGAGAAASVMSLRALPSNGRANDPTSHQGGARNRPAGKV
jgi:hypothetical protein